MKPGLGNYGEVRESSSTAGVLSTQPWLNNATVLSRNVWNGLTSRAGFLANTQAAQLRRKCFRYSEGDSSKMEPAMRFLSNFANWLFML